MNHVLSHQRRHFLPQLSRTFFVLPLSLGKACRFVRAAKRGTTYLNEPGTYAMSLMSQETVDEWQRPACPVGVQTREEEPKELPQTQERAKGACDWINVQVWKDNTFSQYGIHNLAYYEARKRFELCTQMTVRAITKVADTYKTNPDTRNSFYDSGRCPYDSRVLPYYLDNGEVSIWTLGGRERIPITMGKRKRSIMQNQEGDRNLVDHDRSMYLLSNCNVEERGPEDVNEALRVVFGIEKSATDADGEEHSGAAVDAKREWYGKRRAILQSVATRSA